jgi:hypothetical protein
VNCSKCVFEEDGVLKPHDDPCKSCIDKEKHKSEISGKETEINIKTTVIGVFKKKIVFEIEIGNVTYYEYSISDLIAKLLSLEINKTDLWLLLNKIEQKHYKIK